MIPKKRNTQGSVTIECNDIIKTTKIIRHCSFMIYTIVLFLSTDWQDGASLMLIIYNDCHNISMEKQ